MVSAASTIGDSSMPLVTIIIRHHGADSTIDGVALPTALMIARSLHITHPGILVEVWKGATLTHTFN